MSDIRVWLEDLDLSQYAEAFEANEIDLDLARDLTDDTLEKIGVAIAGHRIRILRAISTIDEDLDKASNPTHAKATKSPPPEAERRQITVMFCDLVGSTTLSETLDPEDLRLLMQAYQESAGAIIKRYEGHVAQYLGDGLMTYFGWPRAHEDDPERAVRASLEIVDAVKTVKSPTPLEVRIGIATGPVVVGETGAGDASVPKLAVGETPNLASRVQGLANPGEIVVADSSQRLAAGTFVYEDLGEKSLKGIVEPVHTWKVIGLASTEDRFAAAHGAELTPLVGRDEEVALLRRHWQMAKEGEGQIVLLSGEPGIGKSRITQELRKIIAHERHVRLQCQCSPYHQNSALYPFIDPLERAAAFGKDDSDEVKLEKIEALLGRAVSDVKSIAPLFASMLSINARDKYEMPETSPETQKEQTLDAIASQVVAFAREQPVMMIVEDVHWIDPTTQSALDLLVTHIADHRVLLIITYRSEYRPSWTGLSTMVPVLLTRLSKRHSSSMVKRITGENPLADDVLSQIVAKTDGNPLFVEELTKAVVVEAGQGVPETLQDSLMSQLDRLGTAKEVAQIGACIGRQFSHGLLSAVADQSDADLDTALTSLVTGTLLFRQGTPPQLSYSFKHALVQDAAYDSLLKSRRAEIHRRIAKALETHFTQVVAAEPETVAHHLTEAGQNENAVEYWQRAGQRAAERSANTEAVAHFQNALRLLGTLGASPARDEIELDVLYEQFSPLLAARGYQAAAVETARSRALALCERIGEDRRLFPFLYGRWLQEIIGGEATASFATAEELVTRAAKQKNMAPKISARRMRGHSLLLIGRPQDGVAELAAGLDLLKAEQPDTFEYGNDLEVLLRSYHAQALVLSGYPKCALNEARASLVRARSIGHALSVATALFFEFRVHSFLRNSEEQHRLADEAQSFAIERELPYFADGSRLFKAWALFDAGRYDESCALFERHLGHDGEKLASITPTLFMTKFAEAHSVIGNIDKALALTGCALKLIAAGGERIGEAEVYRVLGEIDLKRGSDPENQFMKAVEVAANQESKLFELRAATALARLWQTQNKVSKALDLLVPRYDWFTEGFDTKDLMEAKVLLDELRS